MRSAETLSVSTLFILSHTQPSFCDSDLIGDEFWIHFVSPLLVEGGEKVDSSIKTCVLFTAWHSQLCPGGGKPDGHWTDPE